MEKHWTAYLPEAGTIKRMGNDISYAEELLNALERDVARQKRHVASLEEDIFRFAKQDWSIEEITQAKLEAKKRT